jgi:hypothetical protein
MPREDKLPRRDRELASRKNGKLRGELIETFEKIRRGFEEQAERAGDIADYWDIYNCILGGKQAYNGNAAMYVPIVRLAVNARCTRFINELFPSSGRNIDITSHDEAGDLPRQMLALLENYVRSTMLKTQVIAALLRNGDIEGHYNLFVDWMRHERHVVSRETTKPKIDIPQLGPIDLPGVGRENVVSIREETIAESGPCLDVLHDTDVLVRPAGASSIENALRQGGDVTILRRWTKETLKELIERGEVMAGPANDLMEMSSRYDVVQQVDKALQEAAGIRSKGSQFWVYETYKVLPTDEGDRLCSSLYGGYDLILSAKRIRFWNDLCPLLSWPHAKIAGSFKGRSSIEAVDTLQYQANDIANQGADSATYSMLPIIMTNPAMNPRTPTMVLNLAAIWECDPNSTRFAEFPKLWQDAVPQIQAYTQLIFQELSVNPAMLPQQTGRPGAKRSQAEVALEQQVDLLTTAEEAEAIEDNGLTPMLALWVDYDHQFREEEELVRSYGKLGEIASMQSVPPQENRNRLLFRWSGVEQARNAAERQQQIAFINVLRGVEPVLEKAGYQLNLAPLLVHAAGNIFGWGDSTQIIVDVRQRSTLDPELENMMMSRGMPVPVHPLDNGPQHLRSHMLDIEANGDTVGEIKKEHIQAHIRQMQMQAMASALHSLMPQDQPAARRSSRRRGRSATGGSACGAKAGARHPWRHPCRSDAGGGCGRRSTEVLMKHVGWEVNFAWNRWVVGVEWGRGYFIILLGPLWAEYSGEKANRWFVEIGGRTEVE